MKRPYEITCVFRIFSNDDEAQAALDQVINWIENVNNDSADGKVTRIDRTTLGRRKLAYEIDGQRDGNYIIIEAEIEPQHLPELELNLKLFNPLLRYLIVRVEKPVTTAEPKRKTAEDTTESVEEETETTAAEGEETAEAVAEDAPGEADADESNDNTSADGEAADNDDAEDDD